MPTSLRSRLAVLFAAGSALLLVVLVAALYLVLDHELLVAVDNGLQSRSGDLAAVVTEESNAPGDEGVGLPNQDPFAQLLATDGRVVDQAPSVDSPVAVLDADQLASVHGTTWIDADVPMFGGETRLLARPVEVQGTQMVLVVGSSLDSYMRARQRLAVVLLVASPVLIGLLAGSGWVLAGAALRPVRRMTDEAAEVPVDDLSRRLAVPGSRDEIEHLARTINALLDRVEQSVAHERRFIDDASHELRTPISILRGELELALARPDDRGEVVASLQSALDEAVRLGRLANDLLVLARARAGELALHPSLVDLREVTERVVGQIGGDVPVTIEGKGLAWADADRVRQIVVNLLSNANRYAQGAVLVRLGRPGAGREVVELTVADDGPGFAQSMLPVSFERFARADPARGRDTGGTGLGLSIVATLVRAQGASLDARNGPPLGGAVVTIEFPAAPESAEVAPDGVRVG